MIKKLTKWVSRPASAIAVCLALLIAVAATSQVNADNFNRQVLIVNNSSSAMMEFYASGVTRSSWEEDILGFDILASGDSVMINIDDGSGECEFDFLAIFEDGAEVTDQGMNVCAIESHTYWD